MRTHARRSRWRRATGMGLLAGLLAAMPVAAQNTLPDVPPDHWAYQAVHDLADAVEPRPLPEVGRPESYSGFRGSGKKAWLEGRRGRRRSQGSRRAETERER